MTAIDTNLTRAAIFSPSTWNAESQTIDEVVSTFADVVRRDGKGAYLERLDPVGLDLSALDGAPLLDGHRTESARDVIGSIIGHRFEGGKLVAQIRLSGAADAAPIVARIAEGTVRGVSIGYHVTKWEESIDPETKTRIRKAVAWVISEASAVPIGADRGAKFRNKQEVDIVATETEEKAETRKEIRTIARAANLSADWADAQIDADATVIEVRAAAFEAIQDRGRALPKIKVGPSNDDPAATMQHRADALHSRLTGAKATDQVKPFHGRVLARHGTRCRRSLWPIDARHGCRLVVPGSNPRHKRLSGAVERDGQPGADGCISGGTIADPDPCPADHACRLPARVQAEAARRRGFAGTYRTRRDQAYNSRRSGGILRAENLRHTI